MSAKLSLENVSGTLFGPDPDRGLHLYEERTMQQGYKFIAGIDEVGRGALAGPVVAAAVIFPDGISIPGINDSKKLTHAKRKSLYDNILDLSLSVGIGFGDHHLVDEINILQATLHAMRNAVLKLGVKPDYLLVDGNCAIPVNIPQKTIIKGDSLSISIAAASIVAKITRDKIMGEFEEIYPGYGFAGHKGYGSSSHLAAIVKLGPCAIHRKTFRGVKEHADKEMINTLFGSMQ